MSLTIVPRMDVNTLGKILDILGKPERITVSVSLQTNSEKPLNDEIEKILLNSDYLTMKVKNVNHFEVNVEMTKEGILDLQNRNSELGSLSTYNKIVKQRGGYVTLHEIFWCERVMVKSNNGITNTITEVPVYATFDGYKLFAKVNKTIRPKIYKALSALVKKKEDSVEATFEIR